MYNVVRFLTSILGLLLGLLVGSLILSNPTIMRVLPVHNDLIVCGTCMLALAIIFYIIFPFILSVLRNVADHVANMLKKTSLTNVTFQAVGLILGLIIAFLISSAFSSFPVPGIQWIITVIMYVVFGYIGWTLPRNYNDEFNTMVGRLRRSLLTPSTPHRNRSKKKDAQKPKLLDTSVIIDGRIVDIFKTKFLEGPLIIPVYVLNELQLISDSAEDLKRLKGRRGLDVVAKLEENFPGSVEIFEEDYGDLKDVDSKLIKTAKDKNYKIITNDYNLNKLASVQGIDILNINELANAVKVIVLPGEQIEVSLIKAGKEPGQAVAYLDDGTMIVVEHAKNLIGRTLDVEVTSILQTAAGRMIFAKPQGG